MISREISSKLLTFSKQFPVVGLMGPRQSGKSTLVKALFSEHRYITLEDIDMRSAAKDDPRHFLGSFGSQKGLIIDEVQEVPELLSYMQGIVDQTYKPGYFILTGSQNFLLYEKITQSLAGRIGLLTLLPLTIDELSQASLLPKLEELILKGLYPRPYDQPIEYAEWFSNYIATYVERDVRQVLKISDVVTFQRFLKLCAARSGQLLNYASLARDCDISPNTAKAWISILETSYIITLLHPYYRNFNKRLIKSPKLYFYDTGLVCQLLGIKQVEELSIHPMRGPLFETLIISELYKYYYNQGKQPPLYFWRDVQGHEVDCIIEPSFDHPIPLEVKAGMTINNDFFKGVADWLEISQQKAKSYVVYAGSTNQQRKQTAIIAWNQVRSIVDSLL